MIDKFFTDVFSGICLIRASIRQTIDKVNHKNVESMLMEVALKSLLLNLNIELRTRLSGHKLEDRLTIYIIKKNIKHGKVTLNNVIQWVYCWFDWSSHPEVFLEKEVLKICRKFTGEHLCRSVISIKLKRKFIEIALRHECSPVNLLHNFRTPFPRKSCFS